MGFLEKVFGNYSQKEIKRLQPTVNKVLALENEFAAMSDAELRGMTDKLKARLANGETLDDILPEAFATCREASWRVLEMKHFPVQILGSLVLHQGRIAEMKTGEGKTLVATLACYLNALAGKGVHVVTVNDYLAKRDSEWMGKVYGYLGLTTGLVVNGLDSAQRRKAYAADITYGTNNEFGFDYLRDNMVTSKDRQVQRGHFFAIVDEVDSILIDEARTPLIISGQGDNSSELYTLADRFAKSLKVCRVAEMDAKEDNDAVLDGDYIVDEKARSATLTQDGVAKAERYFGVENLMDPENMTLLHHINQAIRANGLMQRDVDYVVKDDQIIIVDEFTGRLMIGRRYNEGLHQAIEAKEGVTVAKESKTLASITFQNYFRLYNKLSGMTGTAATEESEFREIYNLDVIEIPTNRPVIRKDYDDFVYTTAKGKYHAVIDQIVECHKKGQPVLVGTVSIEKSELLSQMLDLRGIKHTVLNAKFHEKEAEIVAQAGKLGAVTIATNMAGRGTDIMLGGNAEFMAKHDMKKAGYEDEQISVATSYFDTDDEEVLALRKTYADLLQKHKEAIRPEAEKVREAGGLFIIGTERHESRRIDNQLRGRSGRQGDPGETRFYLSLEDDLMRLFGGDRIQAMMNSLKVEEDVPIGAKMLSNTIESAQAKVEGRNFAIRKNVLQFDDVANRQREVIYKQRQQVLDGVDISAVISKMVDDTVGETVDRFIGTSDDYHDWNLHGLRDFFLGWAITKDEMVYATDEEKAQVQPEKLKDFLRERLHMLYTKREAMFGPQLMRELERVILLKNVDAKWMDHIDAMEDLKKGIYLRSYAQRDPVIEFRMESGEMFNQMVDLIREDTIKMLLTVQVRVTASPAKAGSADESANADSRPEAPAEK
ncbi:MAG: preprotein translocase subunit SecA [Clostridiales bacterium]|nr:preprotein translocase subunit SecA [Clostridiales bacterium]